MYLNLGKAIRKLPQAAGDPRRALLMAWRRMFPFGIVPKDPEAYRIGSWTYGKADRRPLTEVFPGIRSANIRVLRSYDRVRDLSLDAQEVLALCSMVAHVGARTVIEIGTSDGNTTLNLAANAAEGGRVVTIDLPPDWGGDLDLKVPDLMRNVTVRDRLGVQFAGTDYAARITQVFGDSAKIDYSKLPGPFDLAFIDGCHFYDYVRTDTENVANHMSAGGTIVWHDYGMIEDVSRAVDEFSSRRGIPVSVITGTRLAVGRLPG
jgi:predicted O-methyltransferase YrrM